MNDELIKMLNGIRNRYKISFILEKISIDGKVIYHLKRRLEIGVWLFKKPVDTYEVNILHNAISFKSEQEIVDYLRIMFAEPEGFYDEVEIVSIWKN